MRCFLGVKPYSHTPISLFITRGLVHTCTEGAYTWCCTRSVAPTRVYAPHLQAQRHTQWDVGRGGLARAHTCTRRCARTHAAAAQPASHTSSGTQRPLSAHLHKQHFFPSSRTHTLCTRSCCPCPFSWCQKPAQGCPLHPVLVPLALPACGSPQQGGTSSLWLPSGCSPGLCPLCATVTLAQPSPPCLCQHRDHSDCHQVPSEPWGCWGGQCVHWECVCVHKCGAVLGRGICVQGDVFTCTVCTVH